MVKTKISKLMSLVLRHKPEVLGIILDYKGWTDFDFLVLKIQEQHPDVTKEDIIDIVETNDKKRFDLSEDQTKIRANQGHNVNLNLDVDFEPVVLEEEITLYHGTPKTNLESIMATGLDKRSRTHVHLSKDTATAEIVARRYKASFVILKVKLPKGTEGLFIAKNGVYLKEHVSPNFITILK